MIREKVYYWTNASEKLKERSCIASGKENKS